MNTVWQLFVNDDDEGVDIWTEFKQEITVGQPWTRKEMLGQYFQGQLSQSSTLRVDFDIYDIDGVLVEDKLSLQWTPSAGLVTASEHGSTPWGGPFGGDVDPTGVIDSWAGFRGRIANFQRLQIDITEHSQVNHVINWFSLQTKEKVPIRIRNMVQN